MGLRALLNVAELRSRLDGEVVVPGDDGWEEARAAWNLAADQRPAAVVFAENSADIAAAVAFARANELRVAPQGTGHGARPETAQGVLLRTDRMRDIEVDPRRRTARVEAGVIAADLGDAAAKHGLSSLPGTSPDVGVIGYTLGGGLGWLARRHGLACNTVRSIELVTADGEHRRLEAEMGDDLFWALRGGGGGFAVVSALELELVELREVYAGAVVYPADERSGEVLRRFRDWAADAPVEVTAVVRFLHPPPLPAVPESLRDRHLIMIAACHAGADAEGARLTAPLRQLGEPIVETFRTMSPSELPTVAMDPTRPTPSISDTASLTALPDEAIDGFVATAGPDAGSPLANAELRPLGGAVAESADGAGARSHINAAYVLSAAGVPRDPQRAAAINTQIDKIQDALAPWSSSERFANFAGRPTNPKLLYDPKTLARLRDIKQRYDPDGLIDSNLPLGDS